MAEHPDSALIARYLADDLTPEERGRIEIWVAEDPERQVMIEQLRVDAERGGALGDLAGEWDVESHWRAMQGALTHTPSVRSHAPQARRAVTMRPALWRGLAAAAAITLAVWYGVRQNGSSVRGARRYASTTGQRMTVTLADGTRITLAPASQLHVPAAYAAGARAVTLEGEAFFSVVHDANHPFSVHVRNAVATDIGTAFDVRGYPTDPDVHIAVAEGQVAVARDESKAAHSLLPGDLAVVADTVVTITHGVDLSAVGAWTRGELVYRNVPLTAVVADLSRWYGVAMHVSDSSLGAVRVTSSFANDSLSQVLAALQAALRIRAERQGTSVVFYAR